LIRKLNVLNMASQQEIQEILSQQMSQHNLQASQKQVGFVDNGYSQHSQSQQQNIANCGASAVKQLSS